MRRIKNVVHSKKLAYLHLVILHFASSQDVLFFIMNPSTLSANYSNCNHVRSKFYFAIAGLAVVFMMLLSFAFGAPPIITRQPLRIITHLEGNMLSAATISVTATSSLPLTYQWQKDEIDIVSDIGDPSSPIAGLPRISGINSGTLNIRDCRLTDAGSYRVRVSNADGNAMSQEATLIINPRSPPRIYQEPKSITVTEGTSDSNYIDLRVSMVNSYDTSYTYQWCKNGTNLTPQLSAQYTNDSYVILNAVVTDSGTFTVVVSDRWGYSSTTTPAIVTVLPAQTKPKILLQPVDETWCVPYGETGYSASFYITATNASRYQWQKDGVDISGTSKYYDSYAIGLRETRDTTTKSYLRITNLRPSDAGKYRVKVWNSAGAVTSAEATLTITRPDAQPITTHSVTSGRALSLDVSNLPPTGSTIQWQVSKDGGKTWGNIFNDSTYEGVTSIRLNIANSTISMDGYQYRYVTKVGNSTTTGTAITLNVMPVQFPHPVALALSGTILYIADDALHTIQAVDLTTMVATTLAGKAGSVGSQDGDGVAARFNQPRGLSVAQDGVLYLADSGNALIRAITPTGIVTTIAGSPTHRGNADGSNAEATFSRPIALFANQQGYTATNITVIDDTANTIRYISHSGTVSTIAGHANQPGSTDGDIANVTFNRPAGIAAHKDYRYTSWNPINSGGEVAGIVITMPSTWTDSMYIADSYNHTIRSIGSSGYVPRQVITIAGLAGVSGINDGFGADARFNQPGGMVIYGYGAILADTGNSTIRLLTAAGEVITIAGLPGVTGLKDGIGHEAWFNHPTDICLGNGVLYIADTGNAAIRKLDLYTGQVTTLNITQMSPPPGTSGTNPPIIPPTASDTSAGNGGGGGALSLLSLATLVVLLVSRYCRNRFLHGQQ